MKQLGKRTAAFVLVLAMLSAFVPIIASAAAINIGDYIQMGTYYDEPILWRCVDIDENGPLMLSDKILCLKPFDAQTSENSETGSHSRDGDSKRANNGSNYWADSNMRSWLNSTATAGNVEWLCGNPPIADKVWYEYNAYDSESGFLTNFTKSELRAIKEVTQKSILSYPEIDADMDTAGTELHTHEYGTPDVALQNYDKAYAENVTDKMFLLDVKQVNEVYNNRNTLGDDYHIGEPTAKCVENSDYTDDDLTAGNKWHYWLRSPLCTPYYDGSYYVHFVESGESFGYVNGCCADAGVIGVRPAFYLNLSSVSVITGSGNESNPYVCYGSGSIGGNDFDEDAGKNGDYNSYISGIYSPNSAASKTYGVKNFKYTDEGEVYTAVQEFYKACNEYIGAVKSEAENGGNSKDAVIAAAEQLYNDDENSKYKYFLLADTSTGKAVPAKAKKAAYMALAEYFNSGISGKGDKWKVNLDDKMIVIDAKLTKQILSSLGKYNKTSSYNGYDVNISVIYYLGSFTGSVRVSNSKATYTGIINSKPADVANSMNIMLTELRNVTDDVTKQAYRSYINEIGNITGINEWFRVEMTDKLKSAVKTMRKKGFGDVMKMTKRCYDGYEIFRKVILIKDANLKDIDSIKSSLSNAQSMYDKIKGLKYTDSAVDNFVVKQALSRVESARKQLEDTMYDYIYHSTGNPPKTALDKANDWIKGKTSKLWNMLFQCPVDFEVYDKEKNLLGYVKDGKVFCTDDIYIETSGDVKYLFVPEGMEVDIKMVGTDEGELNYVVEETVDGTPTGRLNYYSIPLTDGGELSQSVKVDELSEDTQSMPIVTNDTEVTADEYLSAQSDAFVTVRAETGKYANVLGSGNYVIGDNVELTAVPVDDYSFVGWYIGDSLVCSDITYRFTARTDVTAEAKFEKRYISDDDFVTNMTQEYVEDMYAYVYEESDGTRGIVVIPFSEDAPESVALYVSTYDKNANVMSDSVRYTAELDENGRYIIENVVSAETAKVAVADSRGTAAVILNKNCNIEDGVNISAIGKYDGCMQIKAANTDGELKVELDVIGSELGKNDVDVFAAEYENGVMKSVVKLDVTAENEKIICTGTVNGNDYKIFVWEKGTCIPVALSYSNK